METLATIVAIVACILLFSFAIFIHEFGHFLAARIFGLRVDRFSIGFGPALWKKTVGGVEYRISAIPFGGYVALPQLDPEGTDALQGGTAKGEPLQPIPAWKRIIVAFAGPFGNIVFAVALALLLAVVPGARFGTLAAKIGYVPDKGPAAEAGMKVGDVVKSIGGRAVSTWTEMQTEVQIAGGAAIEFVVERKGAKGLETHRLQITPQRDDVTGAWFIMAGSEANTNGASAWMPSRNPIEQLKWDAGQIVRVLQGLVTPRESKAVAGALGGPVMIAQVLYKQVRRNIWDAVGFLRFVDVNLAILNLLPIPVLDGGLILFALFELLFRRRPPKKLVDGLSIAFMWFFLALMVFLVFRDVSRTRRISTANAKYERQQEQSERRLRAERNFRPAFDLGEKGK